MSDWYCAKCGQRSGMYGHLGDCPTVLAPETTTEDRGVVMDDATQKLGTCPTCRHAEHEGHICLNMASDYDCGCDKRPAKVADDTTQKLVDGLRAEIEDIRGGYTASTAALDRFRDVVCEVTGYGDENPGDDVVIAKLREMHDKIGPEPTRWRDFMVGANAARDQILAHHAADALEAAQRPPVNPEAEVDRLRAQVEAAREAWWSGTEQGDTGLVYTDRIEDAMDAIWDAIGHADWTPRQRPPVSPEQREAVAQAVMGALGCEVLDDTCECDYPCSHGLYAYCKTHDWEVVFNPGAPCPMAARVADAILAGFSLPVLDVEKVAAWLMENFQPKSPSGPLTDTGQGTWAKKATALVASLHTLTTDGTPSDTERNE